MINLNEIEEYIDKYLEEIIEVRRLIHQNPELAHEEFSTTALIVKHLEDLNFEINRNYSSTGVCGLLRGAKPGPTLLLRADIDALPLLEENQLPYRSLVEGKMHACGHDVHTAILLGAAKVLSHFKGNLSGNIKFLFQPAEEESPDGGAKEMVERGILENPKVDRAMALHIWPLPLGTVGLKKGTMMAQSDRIFIQIKGKSSHASQPHEGFDAILTASHIITSIQSIISRNIDPMDSAVITIGTIHGGNRYNVLCDKVDLEGTVRIFDLSLQEVLPKRIREVCENVAAAFNCSCDVKYVPGYKMVVNHDEFTSGVIQSFKSALGDENVIIASRPAPGGEDFSAISERVPSTFYWLGMKSNLNKDNCVLHNPNLIVDESCIKTGILTMVKASLDYLK